MAGRGIDTSGSEQGDGQVLRNTIMKIQMPYNVDICFECWRSIGLSVNQLVIHIFVSFIYSVMFYTLNYFYWCINFNDELI